MENKSNNKYYILGAIVLVVIVILVISLRKPSTSPQNIINDYGANAPISNTAGLPNKQIPPAVATPANNPSTAAANTASPVNGGLVGTWTSSARGKGMTGSGKAVIGNNTYQLNLTSDVVLKISKVENNIGTGTITFNHACIATIISVPGQADITRPADCKQTFTQPAEMQIGGNSITYSGKSVLGADITLTGTYSDNSMSGTFVRTSPAGKINGTFNLVRSGN